MKKCIFTLGAAALTLSCGVAASLAKSPAQAALEGLDSVGAPAPSNQQGAPVAFWLHVLHHADGESQLINAGSGALADFGGVARFKTLADNLKANASTFPADMVEKGYVFVSAGDNFLAGPEFNSSLDNGVPFFDSVAMDLIGYSACAIGNHEFDFNPDVLEQFLLGFGGSFPFLSANLDFSGETGLQSLVNNGRIAKSTVVTVGTQKVGIIGATTTDLPFISTPRNVIVNAVLPAVQAEVAAMQAMVPPVDKIILVSHLQGLSSEAALVPMLSGVDVVVGGGGGELLADAGDLLVPSDSPTGPIVGLTGSGYPRTAIDADGKAVQVVATRGDYRYIGRLIIGFDASGEIVSVLPESGPVRVSGVAPDAVASDPVVEAQVVTPLSAKVAALASQVIAVSEIGLDGRNGEVRSRETNLGSLCADSMLYNAMLVAPLFGAPMPDVALQNGGGIRNNNIIPAGNFTELNTFEVLPFANFVSVVPAIPPAQFKEIMENAVSRVGLSGNGRFAQISGFRLTWDPAGVAQSVDNAGNVLTPGTRVREIVLNDGTVIIRNGAVAPGARNVNIATIDFLARGGDQYPFRGAPFTVLGISYQQALEEYVSQFLPGVISAFEYPEGGSGRIIRLANPANVNDVVNNFGVEYVYDEETNGVGDANFDGVVDTRDLLEILNARRVNGR